MNSPLIMLKKFRQAERQEVIFQTMLIYTFSSDYTEFDFSTPVYPSICLSVYLSIRLSVYISICLLPYRKLKCSITFDEVPLYHASLSIMKFFKRINFKYFY